MRFLLQVILLFGIGILTAQGDVIPVVNPSFEGNPAAGTSTNAFVLGGWFDCAPYYFRGQTPPDVQPGSMEFFDVTTVPRDGDTYLGMVTRQNETWELVSQRLFQALEKGKCYSFEIDLARSDAYFSKLLIQTDTTKKYNFNKPVVLRIWGGRNVYEKRELLAESSVIAHTDWQTYHFEFNLKQRHEYLILEAFYKTPTLLPYNGNILLDNASAIIQIACPGEEPLIVSADIPQRKVEIPKPKKSIRKAPKVKKEKLKTTQDSNKFIANHAGNKTLKRVNPGAKILTELDKSKIREGQIIKIEQLYFKADSSNFTSSSYKVLNEIFLFLIQNPNVSIEIGGHTNGVPGQAYCQSLSLKRARAVAVYLYEKGIPRNRIVYKGYGKIRPIASNKTYIGRKKNQRVEIKILSIG